MPKPSTLMVAFAALTLSSITPPADAHSVINTPYVQTATPTGAWIMWETTGGEESRVEYGPTSALGQASTGIWLEGADGSRIHETQLTGLLPNTRYFYRVVTADAISPTFYFITPPLPGDEASFNLVAMSDMQRDPTHPGKYDEIIHDGIIAQVNESYGNDVAEHLGLVMIPGDLVDDGSDRDRWQEEFLKPGGDLMAYVPFYPVYGNHEGDTPYFQDYFHLPLNGTEGYEEHWWYHDYSNLRVIGLDSNGPYRLDTQLDWLEEVLDDACQTESIDFVFAQLHHPYLSELWPDGETDFTGQVIQLMERFSTSCGKPSVHFFGHTHGYSRGQSRDHSHLWVNVATAGGNIDYWGEYPNQRDYPEFQVSQDEYGFVMVEVDAGLDPRLRILRYSRGNDMQARDNELRDEVEVRRYNRAPARPAPVSPSGAEVDPTCTTLKAGAFSDPDGDLQGAAQWQVASGVSCPNFTVTNFNEWRQYENWYKNEDLQAGKDLTEIQLSLQEFTPYCWRVRYRDRGLAWSEWSDVVSFQTGENTTGGSCEDDGSTGCSARLPTQPSVKTGLGATALFLGFGALLQRRRRR